jgi:predicted nucleotide-binding protein
MFDEQIDHARDMIARLQRCKDEGHERLPSGVVVSVPELTTWYHGVYHAIAAQFGQHSVQLQRYETVYQEAQRYLDTWVRNHPGETTEPGYIAHLQTIVAFLLRLQTEKVTAMTQPTTLPQPDTRKVFVVHGRDERLRRDFFAFLRALGLAPIEWSEAVQMTGKGSPYIGEVLDAAFSAAQAVVVLLTPDDEVRLLPELSTPADPPEERVYSFQARPNVLFEAGTAFGRYPERTVLVEVGDLKRFSDVAGRHAVRLTNESRKRHDVANRLGTAGCLVSIAGADWLEVGDFSAPRGIASPEWYGIQFTTPGPRTTTIERSPLPISGKFAHRPPDGALHIFVVSEDRRRWWPVTKAVLRDHDRTWSAEVPFAKGDFGAVVVAALVSERSVDLVEYFEKLPRHLELSEGQGHREFKERKEFDSLFRDIMSDGIQECDSRNIRVKI